MKKMKKMLSTVLCLAMLAQNVPVPVLAAAEDGLCEHHTEHTAECGYVAPVTGADCGHAHDEACGYVAAVEGHECHYECAECAEDNGMGNPSPTECDCGTDDASIHATNCPAYVAPEKPVCYCAKKCTEVNVWCDVCGFDYSKCEGTDQAAEYTSGSIAENCYSNINYSDITTYNGQSQTLLTATAQHGQVKYSRTDTAEKPTNWTTTAPAATNTGTYYVWYKVDGTNNYSGLEPQYKIVSITKATDNAFTDTPSTSLTYTGNAQTLLTRTAKYGTVQYALGDDATTAPIAGWNTTVPTATEVGTYYVWCQVYDHNNYNGIAPQCTTVKIAKPSSNTITAEANTLTYNGTPQALVTATAEYGNVLYALGTDAQKAPATGYSSTVPTGKDAGTYYVWCKVEQTDNYNGVAAQCTAAVINKATPKITWASTEFAYDGTDHGEATVTLLNNETNSGTVSYTHTQEGSNEVNGLPVKPGDYTVTATVAEQDNYSAKTESTLVVIGNASLTITPENWLMVENSKPTEYQVTGLAVGDTASVTLVREGETVRVDTVTVTDTADGDVTDYYYIIKNTAKVHYAVTPVQKTGGTISTPKTVAKDESVKVSITERTVGYNLTGVKAQYGNTTVDATCTDGDYYFTMPSGNVTVYAVFEECTQHTYTNGQCTCGTLATYTVTLKNTDCGVAFVGNPPTATHGQALTFQMENTASESYEKIHFAKISIGETDIQNIPEASYDKTTGIATITIDGSHITGDVVIDASAYVRVSVNMSGGSLKTDPDYGYTVVGNVATNYVLYNTSVAAGIAFEYTGHSLSGVADTDGNAYSTTDLDKFTKDTELTLSWTCGEGAVLTEVPQKAATCESTGISVTHYQCSCGKRYAQNNITSTVLADKDVITPVIAHVLSYTIGAPNSASINNTADFITETCTNGCAHTAKVALTVLYGIPGYTYTGSEIKPANVSVISGTPIGEYALTYSDNVYPGTATATLTFGDKSVSKTFAIGNASLSDVSVSQSGTLTYTGTAQEPVVKAEADTMGGQTATFTYSLTADGEFGEMPAFTDAKSYTVYYKVSAPYHNDSAIGSFTVTVAPAKLTITADNLTAAVGDAKPALTYKITGLVGTDKLTTEPTMTCDTDMTKGTYKITPSGAEAGSNYTIAKYVEGTLSVYDKHTVTVSSVTNGTVTVSHEKTIYGTQVTITATPKSGYKMSTLTVKDAAGNSYAVSTDNNGKYYFTMPDADVTVKVTFSKISTSTADPTNPKTGDDFNLVFWSGMAMTSLLGFAAIAGAESRRRKFRR